MPLTTFETSCLQSYRNGEVPKPVSSFDAFDLVRYGIWILLCIARRVRATRLDMGANNVSLKNDGSPVTTLEIEIESMVRDSLHLLPAGTALVSEEAGGVLPQAGLAIALDPIDGTWSYLAQADNYSTSLAFYRDGSPIIGMVINPSTGDLGYVIAGQKTRLIQLAMFDGDDMAADLPTVARTRQTPCLIHVHPSRKAGAVIGGLNDLWKQGLVRLVKSAGGSPAYALLEAAKGRFIYINLWHHEPAAPYDLAAGTLLVRGAGGEVMNANGHPIKYDQHTGPFVAGVWRDEWSEAKLKILDLFRRP